MPCIESEVRKLVKLESRAEWLETSWEFKCNERTITDHDYKTYSSRKKNLKAEMLEIKREISRLAAS